MRRLIIIPIIHTEVDLGSLANGVSEAYIQRFGKQKWEQHILAVDAFWTTITQKIDRLRLDYSRLKLYQDGMPLCGNEIVIVQELAAKRSANHQLLLKMIKRGATLIGTEDPGLLQEELRVAKAELDGSDSTRSNVPAPAALRIALSPLRPRSLLEQRDRFIAERIVNTLAEGETGLLFIGLLHQVQQFLSPKISVQLLIHQR